MFIIALFSVAKTWKQPKCLSMGTDVNYYSIMKRWNSVIYYNMVDTGDDYVKWNKPGVKWHD